MVVGNAHSSFNSGTVGMVMVAMVSRSMTVMVMVSAHSSFNSGTGSLRLPVGVHFTMTFEGGVARVGSGNLSASFDFIKTLEVDVFQIGHGHVLHVSMVQSTSFAPEISMSMLSRSRLFNDFLMLMNNPGRRSDINWRGYSLDVDDLGHLDGVGVVNLLLTAEGSADNNKADHNTAEANCNTGEEDVDVTVGVTSFLDRHVLRR